jgi:putative colanic acid biosynthesis acetyltransferase WcaF
MPQKLARFSNAGWDRGASSLKELMWLLLRKFFFDRSILPLNTLRSKILCFFGAKIAPQVTIKPQVKITFPWKLRVGVDSWLGEESWLLNLAPIDIGKDVVISQRAFLCTGSHNWSRESFDLIAKPIVLKDGAWICANVFVGPGVTIGEGCVVTAGSVVTRDLPANMICSGNPAVPVKKRG